MRLLTCVFLTALLTTSCGDDSPQENGTPATPPTPLTWREAVKLNNHAVSLMDQQKIPAATKLFKELTERAPDAPEGWVNLGVALLSSQKNDAAAKRAAFDMCEKSLRHAMTLNPLDAHAPYTLAILQLHRATPEARAEALSLLERSNELAPTDPSIAYRLGMAKRDAGKLDEAVLHLERAARLAPHFSSAWYGLMQAFARLRRIDDRSMALKEYQALEDHAVPLFEKLELKYNFMGDHANVIRTLAPFGDAAPIQQQPVELALAPSATASQGLPLVSKGEDLPHGKQLTKGQPIRAFIEEYVVPRLAPGTAIHDIDSDGFFEVYVADGKTAGRLFDRVDGKMVDVTDRSGISAAIRSVGGVFGDVNHDGAPDLFVYGFGRDALFLNDGKGRFSRDQTIQTKDTLTLSALIADLDHDGDMDIATAGYLALPDTEALSEKEMTFPDDFAGARNHLFNNNRPTIFAETEGTPSFTDIGPKTIQGKSPMRTASITALDADRDGDLDIFLANDLSSNRLLLNDRLWRYHDVAAEWKLNGQGPALGSQALDANQDGWPDILLNRGPMAAGLLLLNQKGGGFLPHTGWGKGVESRVASAFMTPIDFDLDGDQDLLAIDPSGDTYTLLRNSGPAEFTAMAPESLPPGSRMRGALSHDFDGDGKLDIVLAGQGGGALVLVNQTQTTNRGLKVTLRGKRQDSMAPVWANHFGVGAFLEVASGERRVYHDHTTTGGYLSGASPTLTLGVREATGADYVRVIWPDMVLQSESNMECDEEHVYHEANRKPSSCPVLFVGRADGSGFDFVTDFLGVGGLGFFVAPGEFAPPDSTEVVRIGEMNPHDGVYKLRVAEPMEEVCFLDELKLIVADHPAGTVVHADERLATAPPWPEGTLLCFGERHHPTKATSTDGKDATKAVARTDRVYPTGLELDHRFVGYLHHEQKLTLQFNTDAILKDRPSPSARLICCINGWTEYPYSHVNFAAWQAGVRSQSISLDVPGQSGEWTAAMKEFGYPAGLSRTMAVDVTDALLGGAQGRFRLRTNLEVSFDEIFLAWSLGPDSIEVHEIDFDEATLFHLGYPREHSTDGRLPKIYDHDIIDEHIEWKSMKGELTPFGDVRELLREAKDDLVIFGHGEALELSVKSQNLPNSKPGMTRTFFLRANGWCKDMDAYTAHPDTIGPLPYHGMSNYPPDESKAPKRSEPADMRVSSGHSAISK